jgi:hypothetical protein
MNDQEKITLAKRALAQIADLAQGAINNASNDVAWQALVAIRELAQNRAWDMVAELEGGTRI